MADTPRTEADLVANSFQDGQPNNSISAQDMRDLTVSSKFLNGDGWEFHLDAQFTPAAPRLILAGVRTQVTIDGGLADFGHPAVTHNLGHFWDTTQNKVVATGLNNFAFGRFAVTAQSVSNPTNRFELEVDVVTGTFPVIYQETATLAKPAGVDQNFNFVIPLFVGPDFLANGATAFITPQADMTFHTHALTCVLTGPSYNSRGATSATDKTRGFG